MRGLVSVDDGELIHDALRDFNSFAFRAAHKRERAASALAPGYDDAARSDRALREAATTRSSPDPAAHS